MPGGGFFSFIMDNRNRKIRNVTLLGSAGNLALLVFKFLAAVLGHSTAMLADAIHSLSDFITDIIVLVFVGISSKPKDDTHDFGHGKYETLATAIIGCALMCVGVGLFVDGVSKVYGFYAGTVVLEKPGMIALVAALVSIVVKELLFHVTRRVGLSEQSPAVVANAWHHRSDALSSVATAIGIGGAIAFGASWRVLDPMAAAIVSLLIMRVAWTITVPALQELLENSLPEEQKRRILDIVTENGKVSNPHNLYTRKIGSTTAIELHIRVDGRMSVDEAHALTTGIERRLRAEFGQNTHIMLHIEPLKDGAA